MHPVDGLDVFVPSAERAQHPCALDVAQQTHLLVPTLDVSTAPQRRDEPGGICVRTGDVRLVALERDDPTATLRAQEGLSERREGLEPVTDPGARLYGGGHLVALLGRDPVEPRLHPFVAELASRAEADAADDGLQRLALARHAGLEAERATEDARVERDQPFGERLGQHGERHAGEVVARAPRQRALPERAARADVVARVGEGVAQNPPRSVRRDVKRLVEVARPRVVDRDVRARGVVEGLVLQPGPREDGDDLRALLGCVFARELELFDDGAEHDG